MKYRLRGLEMSDVHTLSVSANNPKIWENLRDTFPYPYNESNAVEFIELVNKSRDLILGIEIEGDIAGVAGILRKTDVHRLNGEIGYWLAEKYWNKNIMTKVIGDVMKIAFEDLQLRRVYAEVFSGNEASFRVLEKNGFKLEAVIKENIIKNNQIKDTYLFSKFNPKREELPRTG